jgi:hypothetical protein
MVTPYRRRGMPAALTNFAAGAFAQSIKPNSSAGGGRRCRNPAKTWGAVGN